MGDEGRLTAYDTRDLTRRSLRSRSLQRPSLLALVILASFPWLGWAQVIERPSVNGKPTEVGLAVFVVDVDEVDSASQSFTVNVYYEAGWTDPRLIHDTGTWVRPLSEVWHPRIQIVNQQRVWATFDDVVEIDPFGRVAYRQRVWGQMSQPYELRDFPLDRQSFTIQFVAAGYTPEEIVFTTNLANDSGMAERLSLADWTVVDWKLEPASYQPMDGSQANAGMSFTFIADRRAGYFILSLVVPLVLIVAMSSIVFWINPQQSGTQINVSVTSMLTLIAYRFMVGCPSSKLIR